MFVRLLIFLLLASPVMAVNVYVDTLKDTTYASSEGVVFDTYIKGGTDSVSNNGASGSSEVTKDTRFLIKTGNLKELIGTDRRISACTLVFTTGSSEQNLRAGVLGLHEMFIDWTAGFGRARTGALWRYAEAPLYPDTTPQASLPSYFSWPDSALDTDTKDQLGCGSCYAHAAAGGFETAAKIQGAERNLGYNTGNGTGADRSIAPFDTITTASTGWRVFNLSPLEMWAAYSNPDSAECGFAIVRMSGEYTINTTENANTNFRPKIFTYYEIDSLGHWELTKSITGTTNLSDVGLFRDGDSAVAHGADTSFTFSETNNTYLLKINDVRSLFGDSVSSFATVWCSLYVKVKTTDGYANVLKPFKKWVENEATGTVWKTGYRWHTLGAGHTNEIDASEQQLLNCGGFTCDGGTPSNAFEHWRQNGVYSEEDYPYKSTDTLACTDTTGKSLDTRLQWWWYVDHATVDEIKQQVLIRPVTSVIQLYSNFGDYTGGCFIGDNLSFANGHAVTIVGWNDTLTCGSTTGAWLVKNSWGEDWGEYGRGWLAYDTNACVLLGETNSGNYVIAETVDEPQMWSAAGLTPGTDYSETPCATVTVTRDEAAVYKVPIPREVVSRWYTDPSSNAGIMIRPYFDGFIPPSDTAIVGIGQSAPPSGRPPTQKSPYFIIRSSDATTNIGNTAIGNTNIGR